MFFVFESHDTLASATHIAEIYGPILILRAVSGVGIFLDESIEFKMESTRVRFSGDGPNHGMFQKI